MRPAYADDVTGKLPYGRHVRFSMQVSRQQCQCSVQAKALASSSR
jgi:hypothetical protein